jgi:hypothetical protein
MKKDTEIYRNKKKGAIALLIVVFCLAFCLAIGISPDSFHISGYYMQGRLQFLKLVWPIFSGILIYAAYHIAKPIFHSGPGLIISEDGLYCDLLPKNFKLKWTDISAMNQIFLTGVPWLVVTLKQPDILSASSNFIGRWTYRSNLRKYGGSILIPLNVWKYDAEPLNTALQNAFASHGSTAGKSFWTE